VLEQLRETVGVFGRAVQRHDHRGGTVVAEAAEHGLHRTHAAPRAADGDEVVVHDFTFR